MSLGFILKVKNNLFIQLRYNHLFHCWEKEYVVFWDNKEKTKDTTLIVKNLYYWHWGCLFYSKINVLT